MNAVATVIGLYRKLHAVAPASEAGKRLLNDVASWALFSLIARCLRSEKPSRESERNNTALAALAAIGYRSGGPTWLDDQIARAVTVLSSPSAKDRGDAAARAWAEQTLSPAQLDKAKALARQFAESNALRNRDQLPGAIVSAKQYLASAGAFDKSATLEGGEGLDRRSQEALCKRLRSSIAGSVEYLFARGDYAASAMLARAQPELESMIADAEPAFDDSWVADFEFASAEARDLADEESRAYELDAAFREVAARTA
jgi:hypothetical protein